MKPVEFIMNKKRLIFFLLLIIFKLFSGEKIINFDNETVKIIQKSEYKFEYMKNGRYLTDSTSIIDALADIPEAQIMYKKAHNGFIAVSTMYGFGIGISSFCTIMEVISMIMTPLHGIDAYPVGITAGFGSGLIVSIIMMVAGIVYRGEFRQKEVEAIRSYNQKKILLFSFEPFLDFYEKTNVLTGIILAIKI
jgi:hypothetical protein